MSNVVVKPSDPERDFADPTNIVPTHPVFAANEEGREVTEFEDSRMFESMADSSDNLPWHKKPSAWWITAPTVITAISIGTIMAPMIQFYTQLFCNEYYHSMDIFPANLTITDDIPYEQCNIPEVQALVSNTQAIIHVLSSISALLVTGYYGALSDSKGRKYVLQIPVLGSLIHMVLMIITAKFQKVVGIRLLFVAPIVKGLTGGHSTAMAASHAYISDCTEPAKRSVEFGRITSMFFLGGVIGPSLGSFLLKIFPGDDPIINLLYFVVFIETIWLLYIVFIVPESNRHLKAAHKPKTLREKLNIFSALGILLRPQTHNTQVSPYALTVLAFVHFIAIVGLPFGVFVLYAMLKFKWTAYESGIFFSVGSAERLVILLGFLPLLMKFFKEKDNTERKRHVDPARGIYEMVRDQDPEDETMYNMDVIDDPELVKQRQLLRDLKFDVWVMRVGYGVEALALFFYAIAPSTLAYFGAAALGSLASIAHPSMRSLFTNLVPPTQTGELLGAISVVDAIAGILSPLIINSIYSTTVGTMPNLIFFLCAGVFVVATALTLLIKPVKGCWDQGRLRI